MSDCSGEKRIWYLNNGNQALDLSTLPRCQATATRTGQQCKRAACKGKRYCGIHSGRYVPGPRVYNKPALSHGYYTEQAQEERTQIGEVLHRMNGITSTMNNNMKFSKEGNIL